VPLREGQGGETRLGEGKPLGTRAGRVFHHKLCKDSLNSTRRARKAYVSILTPVLSLQLLLEAFMPGVENQKPYPAICQPQDHPLTGASCKTLASAIPLPTCTSSPPPCLVLISTSRAIYPNSRIEVDQNILHHISRWAGVRLTLSVSRAPLDVGCLRPTEFKVPNRRGNKVFVGVSSL